MAKAPKSRSMPQVQLQTLKTLLAIRNRGSARLVADDFGMTVSAITRQIQELEVKLGMIKLFERHSRGMQLTTAGEKYAEAADAALKILEHAQETINLNVSARTKRIGIHISEVLVEDYLLPVLNSFCAEHPEIYVDVSVGFAEDACIALRDGESAFGTMFGVDELKRLRDYPEIEVVKNVSYPLIAVVHREHNLAVRKSITPGDLLRSGWPLALPPKRYSTRQYFIKLLKQMEPSVELDNFVEVNMNSFYHLKQYAMLRRAVVIMPGLAATAELAKGTLVGIPIDGIGPDDTRFSLCRHRTRALNTATEKLFEMLHREFCELAAATERRSKG